MDPISCICHHECESTRSAAKNVSSIETLVTTSSFCTNAQIEVLIRGATLCCSSVKVTTIDTVTHDALSYTTTPKHQR